MKRKNIIIAAALAVTALGGGAIAAEAVIGQRGPMAADTDKDGIVSRSEFFTAAENRFVKRDANGDRKLSGDEIETGKRGEKLLREDANGDGVISFAEATAAVAARFKAQDADRNGKLTAEEARPKGPHGPGMRGRGEMGGMMLRRADRNNDGKISRDELRAQSDQHFDRLDANRDGFIDKTEMEAAHSPGRGHGGAGGDMPPPPPPPAGE